MTKILTVIGATGNQGRSVVTAALKEKTYTVRAVTRNTSSAKAKELSELGVEVVQADLDDLPALTKALKGTNALFGVTDFFAHLSKGYEGAIAAETTQALNLAKAASQTNTLEHFVWSTLPNTERELEGKIRVPHFVAKAIADDFIKKDAELLSKTSFLWPGCYAQDYFMPLFYPSPIVSLHSRLLFHVPRTKLTPQQRDSGMYVEFGPISADAPVPSSGDASDTIGKFAMAILQQPKLTLPGRYINATVEFSSMGKRLQDWCAVTGKKAVYVQITMQEYEDMFPGWGEEIGLMLQTFEALGEKCYAVEPDVLTKEDLGFSISDFDTFKDNVKNLGMTKD